MKAFYYTTITINLVRPNAEPLYNDISEDLYSDIEDFRFGLALHFLFIKKRFPTAIFQPTRKGARVLIDGKVVYETTLIHIDPTPIEIPEDGDFDD
jgi:hypothetical protein